MHVTSRFGSSDTAPGVLASVSSTRVFSVLSSCFTPPELALDPFYRASAKDLVPAQASGERLRRVAPSTC